jgi:hypothetical protein
MDWIKRKTRRGNSASVSATDINRAASPSPAAETNSHESVDEPKNVEGHEGLNPEVATSTSDTAVDEKGEAETSGHELTQAVSTASNDDHVVYPHGFRLTVITVSLCCAVFLVALDQTIIATAMYPSSFDVTNAVLE